MKLSSILKNLSYTILSNFISLAISTLVVLIVPKFVNITAYGYWQLYIFYTSYVGVLHFGWLDGIYLRYGGKTYEELDKDLFHSQFSQLTLFQLVLAFFMIILALLFASPERKIVFIASAIAMVLMNLNQFSLYVLQDTARIREYATNTSIGRIVYFAGVVGMLFLGVRKFEWLIVADLFGRFIAMLYGFSSCKDIIFRRGRKIFINFKETITNLSVGVKLLLANFASSLIIGIVRYSVQYRWGVRIFGQISLTLNVSNLLMIFISAVSLVLYPTLRRLNKNRLRDVYVGIKDVLVFLMLCGLLLYYPIDWVLPQWLPKYQTALQYMSLLFPMCVYSSKFSLLIATFMKTYRMEKQLLFVNLFSLGFSVLITVLNLTLIQNLTFAMMSIVIVLWVQSTLGEFVLAHRLKVRIGMSLVGETALALIFVLANSYLGSAIASLFYIISLGLYFVLNKRSIQAGVQTILH